MLYFYIFYYSNCIRIPLHDQRGRHAVEGVAGGLFLIAYTTAFAHLGMLAAIHSNVIHIIM